MSSIASSALEAGRIYKVTGGIKPDLLRAQIYHAWERAHLLGANPRALKAEKISSLETERLIDKHSTLINAVRPYFRTLSQAVGKERHAVMLSDRQAILLDLVGDEQTIHHSEGFPTPGSLLSEAVAGVNGIGTSLAEENYVEIVTAEHFIEGFHPFTCQGIPLRNEKRDIVGVLSISLQYPDVGQRLKEILLCASHGIEAELVIANLETDIRRVLSSKPDDYQPLEELRQDIIQGHQAARLQIEVSSRMVAVNRLDYAMKLLQQAEQSIQKFRSRAEIWRTLASFEIGAMQSVSLIDSLNDLVDILSTEANIRRIEVLTYYPEPITVLADPRSLLRKLLRYFLQAFESAGKGGTVKVAVNKILFSEVAQITFTSIPGLNTFSSEPTTHICTLPIGNKNYDS